MKTSELVEKLGISKDSLRYYEKLGLLNPNRDQYARYYDDKDVERIRHIQLSKKLGFSLNEIKILVDFDDKYLSQKSIDTMPICDQEQLLSLLQMKLADLDEKMILIKQSIEKLKLMVNKVKSLSKDQPEEKMIQEDKI